jgi:hypothetical protein
MHTPTDSVLEPDALLQLGEVLCTSPRSTIRRQYNLAALRTALNQPYSADRYLTVQGVDTAARALQRVCFDRSIALRTSARFVGSHRFPEASAFPALFKLARHTVAQESSDALRVGLLGLLLLLIHPLTDGNGRLARLAWLHGLVALHRSPVRATEVVTEVVGVHGLTLEPLLLAANQGQFEPFKRAWQQTAAT